MPGIVPALIIVLAVISIEYYEAWIIANTPFNATIIELVLVPALVGVLKGLDLRNDQKDVFIDLIGRLLARERVMQAPPTMTEGMRSAAGSPVSVMPPPVQPEEVPIPPSKMTQLWFG